MPRLRYDTYMSELKPGIFLDNDGTLFKSSLLEKAVDESIKQGIFPAQAFERAMEIRDKWQTNNSEGTYVAYTHELVGGFVTSIAGVSVRDLDDIIANVVKQHQVRRHRFPQILMRAFRPSHTSIMVSGSPEMCVRPFVADLPLDLIVGSTFAAENDVYTGEAKPVDDKASVRHRLIDQGVILPDDTIVVGDTMGDASLMHVSSHPIMFNPSRTLRDVGIEFGWPIVHEVKDNITVLQLSPSGAYTMTDVSRLIESIKNTHEPAA